jgi:hypothetical protein
MNDSEEIDVAMLRDSGWWEGSTAVHSGSVTGPGMSASEVRTPLQALLAKEAAEEGTPEYQEQRMQHIVDGAILILRAAIKPGRRVDVVDVGLTICTWAWDIGLPPFDKMSQGDVAELAGQGRAAICERHKQKAEKAKNAVGAKATKSLRQKGSGLTAIYAAAAKGNKNRAMKGIKEALRKVG